MSVRIEEDSDGRTVIHDPRRIAPGVVLINPKYEHNIGGVIRSCSCFGVKELLWTGNRINIPEDRRMRIPREERMKGYKNVRWEQNDRPFDMFRGATPVAIELTPNAEPLTTFEHPDDAVYVFGPEDGSISQMAMRHCHRFVFIPSAHCLNLAAAVNIVLSHRRMSRQLAGKEPIGPMEEILQERRGDAPALELMGWDGK